MNWSGVSVDDRRGILIAPTNRLAMVVRLFPRDSLRAVATAHPDLEFGRQTGTPYAMSRDNLGTCTPPPWGALTAFDLSHGRVMWQVPLGYMPALASAPGGGRAWGSFNLGGALLTEGGLVFIAGTYDQHLRAFDIETGKERWSAELPAAAQALPMSYEARGRQYVVIAAGGHDRLHTTMGDYVLAFTLPAPGAPVPDTMTGSLDGDCDGRDAHWRRTISDARDDSHRWRLGGGDRAARFGRHHRPGERTSERPSSHTVFPLAIRRKEQLHGHAHHDARTLERRLVAGRGRYP